jgi:hypothetical protein
MSQCQTIEMGLGGRRGGGVFYASVEVERRAGSVRASSGVADAHPRCSRPETTQVQALMFVTPPLQGLH